MRIVVTGAAGQLGTELLVALEAPGREVVATDVNMIDIGRRDEVVGAICSLRPDVIIHAAAMTNVDACEDDPDGAFRVNALGVRHVADGARRVGAHVLILSTDYVFDGTAARPYVEWDACNPQSVYGRSKRGGELELDPGSTIVRTSGLFGRHGHNIVKLILQQAAGEGELRFVDDQHTCTTSADDLAALITRLAIGRMPGIFHATNQGATTWYDFARDVLRFAGHDPARVRPISTVELGRPAPRPAFSVLDNAALRASGIPLLPDHREPLERLVKELTKP